MWAVHYKEYKIGTSEFERVFVSNVTTHDLAGRIASQLIEEGFVEEAWAEEE